jgi:hypothetical protein
MTVELYLIGIGWAALIAWWVGGWAIRATIRQLERRALEAGARGDPNFWWGVHLRQRLGRMPTLRELAAAPTEAEKVHDVVYGRWPAQAPVPEPPDPRALDLDPDETSGGRGRAPPKPQPWEPGYEPPPD